MLIIPPLADPALHRAAASITNRFLFMVRPVLRGADQRTVTQEIYALVREELEKLTEEKPKP
jgi:hypothetical protein